MIFRVQFRKDGAIASCVEVEASLQDGEHVVYVDAKDKASAITEAKKLRQRFQVIQEARNKQNRCARCGAPKGIRANQLCVTCQEKHYARKKELIELRKLPPAQAAEALRKRRELFEREKRERFVRQGYRARDLNQNESDKQWDEPGYVPKSGGVRAALRQCLRAYDRDPAGFRDWLLAKLGERKAEAAE